MKVANMQDEIKKLIELQGLDTEMFETKRVLDGIPEKIKEFDELMESKKSSLKVLEDELKKAQVERKGKK